MRDPRPAELLGRLHRLADAADALADAMDFRPLYRPERHLFAIGYNLVHGRLDNACYDLMASECCLTSYLTVARGEAPRRHWFQLGRPFIRAAGRIGLISWGGTMFEYLMPRLMLRSLPGTLLAEACRTAVDRQIEYGRELGLPWGISESGFAAQYLDGDYQYQAFGTPGLGLKQGLDQDRVIAPYATAMATMLAPREALENFRRLTQEGAEGEYGYYEAIDYTPERLPKGKRSVVVRSYMAHHQGMGLVALNNALHADVMTHRFQAEPMVRAIDLLLEERVPSDAPIVETVTADNKTAPGSTVAASADHASASADAAAAPMSRRLTTPFTPAPRTHLLSNTQYHIMLTNAGSGVSTCRGLDMTRWREDAAREAYGQFAYIRDLSRNAVWSAGFQPVCRTPETYEVIFAADKATFRRRDLGIETVLEVIVSPEHRGEIRRITLINHDAAPRELELTSYAEIVLAPRGADIGHPAFAKLFLETEWLPGPGAIVCRRRMRSASEQPLWAVHVSAVDASTRGSSAIGDVQYETDRMRFLGRGRTVANPAAMDAGAVLSGTVGPVLDPVVSLRRRLRIDPGGSAVVALVTAFAESRDEAMTLADQFREAGAATRAFELAWAQSQVEHRHHGTGADAHLYQRLASHIIFAGSALRAEPSVAAARSPGPARPLAVRHLGRPADRAGADRRLGRAAAGAPAPGRARLPAGPGRRVRPGPARRGAGELPRRAEPPVARGGARLRGRGAGRPAGRDLRAQGVADERGRAHPPRGGGAGRAGRRARVAGQPARPDRARTRPCPAAWCRRASRPAGPTSRSRCPRACSSPTASGASRPTAANTACWSRARRRRSGGRNGPPAHGVHHPAATSHLRLPPAPWVNVVANPAFGFVASEAGSGFTWAINSQANRLTPWSNDPVSDPPGEVIYLRDEETGEVWSPTPLPVPSAEPTLVRHGQGYTSYERNTHGLAHELTLFVPPEDPVKLIRLKVRNAGDRPRRLSATFYAEWVLGLNRDASAMHVVTEVDAETGALLARNAFRTDFSARVAFADVDRRPRTLSADRLAFLGRHGSLAAPAAMGRQDLAGRVGAAIDPCAALHVAIELEPGGEAEVVFLIGEADDADSARALARRYREPGRAAQALRDVRAGWDDRLGTVQVRTPDAALDLLANRWLLYQVLACRYWARSGFYQSGGAYGFRDQLQDVMAMVHAAPEITRAHILHAASHQFLEGDVQHWWHPPVGRGIRTRISDDPAWLAFVAGYYIDATGDAAILDESVDYLEAPPLKPEQEDDYGLAPPAGRPGPLYEHCLRGLDRVDHRGVHGLPLMGTGDWNDGMNRVGAGGKGESVWLAWFAIAAFRRFADLAEARGDSTRAADLRRRAGELAAACEANAWDGAWYRRAYFDDGTPLGSARNTACQIDSLAQSWAVLCGAANPDRAAPGDGGRRRPAGRPRGAADPPVRAAVRRRADGPRLHQGLPAGHPRERRPVHPRGRPGSSRRSPRWDGAGTPPSCSTSSTRSGTPRTRRASSATRSSPTSWPATSTASRPTSAAAAGPGTPARPPGCIARSWSRSSGSIATATAWRSTPESRPTGPATMIAYRFRSATYRIAVENPRGLESGKATVWLDGQAQAEPLIPLADDGRSHDVRVEIS